MGVHREERLAGLDGLAAVTELLQRNRRAHPTAGLYEAADLQWWWSQRARSTDDLDQLVWFDDEGRPVAAVIATATPSTTRLDPLLLPDATPARVAHVMARGIEHAAASGLDEVTLEVAQGDEVLRAVLADHGFAVADDGLVEAWLDASARPAVSARRDGYRLLSRLDTEDRPHHMISEARGHTDPEPRLRQTSLYRPDLDLVVLDAAGGVAAYGLFWYDPVTGTGLVEPMRTEDAHQRRGLARHVLTAGLDRLARLGARRVKICFEPGNAASSHLYVDVGFEPIRRTDVFSGRTHPR